MRCALTIRAASSTSSFIRTRLTVGCPGRRVGIVYAAQSGGSVCQRVQQPPPARTTAQQRRVGPNEAVAFAAFPTANDLAEALSAAQDSRRAAAVAAMRGIYHVKSSYADWLVDVDYLRSRRDDILWVGQTSRLAADFERLKQILGLPVECALPADPVASIAASIPTKPACLRSASRTSSDGMLPITRF